MIGATKIILVINLPTRYTCTEQRKTITFKTQGEVLSKVFSVPDHEQVIFYSYSPCSMVNLGACDSGFFGSLPMYQGGFYAEVSVLKERKED